MTRAGAAAKIGILGGTFDPIHLGHVRAAEEMRARLSLDRVVLVPAAVPPHKTGRADAPLASPEQRLAWTRAALASRPGLEVDGLELERAGPSYTVDTVRAFAEQVAPERPVFIIGDDAFALFSTWRAPEELLQLAHFAVMTRPPAASGNLHDWLPERVRAKLDIRADGQQAEHRDAGTWIRIIPIDALEVSSSEVRQRLRRGDSVHDLIPEEVCAAVEASGVYAAPLESEPQGEAEAGVHP